MTREEFMEYAEREIDKMIQKKKNSIKNLIEQAWAEGKRSAEVSVFEEVGNELINVVQRKVFPTLPNTITTDKTYDMKLSGIPDACKNCPNHPSNGGSGICHCIMGVNPSLTVAGGTNETMG